MSYHYLIIKFRKKNTYFIEDYKHEVFLYNKSSCEFFATVLFINLNNVKILMKTIKDQLCNIVGVMIKEGLYEQIINE